MADKKSQNLQEDPTADDEESDSSETLPVPAAQRLEYTPEGPAKAAAGGGFMHIHKSGQGYWTRMITAGVAALVVILICQWLYATVLINTNFPGIQDRDGLRIGIVAALFLAAAVLIWRTLNKPSVVDFLIETEKEMGKVNWTGRKELFGSTRVVIIFIVLMSTVLFLYDIVFIQLFKWMNVLGKNG